MNLQQLVSFSWSILCSQKKQLQHIRQPLHNPSYLPHGAGKTHGVAHKKSWAILKLLFIFQTVQLPHPTNHTFGWALVPTQRMQQKCTAFIHSIQLEQLHPQGNSNVKKTITMESNDAPKLVRVTKALIKVF